MHTLPIVHQNSVRWIEVCLKTRQATLRDVARKASVGIATASRVMNARGSVSAAKLATVLAAVQQLGYQADHAARTLKGGRTKIMGLIVPTINESFFSSCVESVERVARQHDSVLMLAFSHNDLTMELEQLALLMRHRPEGVLIVPSDPDSDRFLAYLVMR